MTSAATKHGRSIHSNWCTTELPLTCKAGTVVIIHYDIWHRANLNKSNKVRWMFKFQFVRSQPPSKIPSWNFTDETWKLSFQDSFGVEYDWEQSLAPFPDAQITKFEHGPKISEICDLYAKAISTELLNQIVTEKNLDILHMGNARRCVGFLLNSVLPKGDDATIEHDVKLVKSILKTR
jgi:hypothetical protein